MSCRLSAASSVGVVSDMKLELGYTGSKTLNDSRERPAQFLRTVRETLKPTGPVRHNLTL